MHGTMMDYPLTITALMRHGRKVHANSRILTYRGPGDIAEATFAETAGRAWPLRFSGWGCSPEIGRYQRLPSGRSTRRCSASLTLMASLRSQLSREAC